MNLKSIQRNYEHMSALERLSLLDNALSREDESEVKAVAAASPRKTYSAPDYSDLFEKINKMRFCNLIIRLGHAMEFDIFSRLDEDDEDDDESISGHAKLAAYLYVRATDSWKAVSDELCLRPDYDKEISSILPGLGLLTVKDRFLREFAFTETETRDYLEKQTGNGEIKTLADETNALREVLGLPKS
jgi:hypothetical protein